MKKIILVIIDGVGDLPSKELNGKTPLEAARTPNLDYLAAEGKCGYMYPIKEKIAPESDSAVTAILGYDPYKYFTGRGPLEAFGSGIKMNRGDLAVRINFSTVKLEKGKKIIVDRRAGRTLTTAEAAALAKTINKKVHLQFPFVFKSTTEHRGALVIRGGFSDNITNTDPAYMKAGAFAVARKRKSNNEVASSIPLDDEETSALSAALINSFVEQSYIVLNNHPINNKRRRNKLLPANIILTRDAGIELPDFPKKHRRWGAIVSLPLEKAIAKLAGMHVLKFRYPELKTNNVYAHLHECLSTEINTAKRYLKKKFKRYDCFYVHLKETDIPGHDGLPKEKLKMIEKIDKEFFGFLRSFEKGKVIIIVTADHSTPCSLRVHSADPVPVLIQGIGKDSVQKFSEKECRKGELGKMTGKDLLYGKKLLKNL